MKSKMPQWWLKSIIVIWNFDQITKNYFVQGYFSMGEFFLHWRYNIYRENGFTSSSRYNEEHLLGATNSRGKIEPSSSSFSRLKGSISSLIRRLSSVRTPPPARYTPHIIWPTSETLMINNSMTLLQCCGFFCQWREEVITYNNQ